MNNPAKAYVPMALVLDTNVVLDWLVFSDPCTHALGTAIQRGTRLISSVKALDELERVLRYPQLNLAIEKQKQVLAEYRTHVAVLADISPPAGLPRCRDPDDQHFLELAVFGHANILVSRDKALLKLRSKMKRFGVRVLDLKDTEQQLMGLDA